ncbi:MAG TPA: amino acid adenylation domain-containing protein [Longimicrobium sp.]|nr:amino acid adenylation domain-containing protein [Longimicrobium sp.]
MSGVAAGRVADLSPEQRARLVAALRERAARRGPSIPRRDPSVPAPLSFEQRRLWILDQLDPGSPAYNVAVALDRPHEVDAVLLGRALDDVAARHEILRTTFHADPAGPVQVVHPPAPVALRVVDLSALPGHERAVEAERVTRAEEAHRFDLAAAPPLRVTLLRLDATRSRVLLVMHHLVTDATSTELLVRQVMARYAALAAGDESPLPELPFQYADFAAWQHQWARGPEFAGQLAFWREHLAGAPPLLELATDHPRPLRPSFRGASVPLRLPPALALACRTLARERGTTLFAVLLSAFADLLARYSGQEDVVVGVGLANRGALELEEQLGFFSNLLPLRAALGGDPDFLSLLDRVHAAALGVQEHQRVPFELLVEALHPVREPGRNPVYQVVFSMLGAGGDAGPDGDGAAMPPAPFNAWATQFDLTFAVNDRGGGAVGGALEFNLDLFRPETVERMARHYTALLEAAVARPRERLSRLSLLRAGERAQVVAEWNATERPCPHACIHELFEAQARRTPDAVAVVCGDERMTYAELDAAANRMAHHLRRRGAGPEVRVGLCMERAPELMAAFFGILKAGAAYVALDPGHPAERLSYMLRDSGARLLLTQSRVEARLPADRPETLFVDRTADEIAAEPDDRPESGARPENLAYVYYTSGSTGRPKGVAMHHYGPANYFAWGTEAYRANQGRGAPVFSSMAVDLTLANFIPLFCGERVELLPEGPGVEALAEAIRRAPGFSMIKITPTHLSLLNHVLAPEDAARSTRTLVIGADNLLAEPTHFWRRHAPGVRLLNEYGPTETVVGCSLYEIPADRHDRGRIPIGRPIDNLTMYVLDAHLQPLPPGVPGELYIGGVGVARGYLGRPGLTAEKFVPDPFAAEAGARFYRTGDRARFLADGDIEFLGRVDFQVKIRGYRIETGEIESVLAAHPSVRAALVMAREDVPGDRRLVAYVDAAPGTLSVDDLRRALREKVPEYMVPAAFVVLDGFPTGSTGKVDRRSLPAPAAEARDGDADGYAAPVTPAERALAELWEEVLNVRPVGVDDDFFALGGHSMLAVRLMSEVRRRMGAELPLSSLFERPTVRRLAPLLDSPAKADGWSPLVALQPEGERVPVFFVHPIGGQVLCYQELARAMGPGQPFYGLQAPDLAQVGDEEVTLEEMATGYVRAIRAVRPSGPYLLGGWSFGGMVAFEMAQQLTRAGEVVPLVALLDTVSPERIGAMVAMDEAAVLSVLAYEEGLKAGREVELTAAELRPLDRRARVERTLDALRRAGVLAARVDPEWVVRLLAGHRARHGAMARYTPAPYPGRLALFRAGEALPDPDAPAGLSDPAGWRPYTAFPLRVEVVPGHHATMGRGPQAALLAARLRKAFDEALLACQAAPHTTGPSPS